MVINRTVLSSLVGGLRRGGLGRSLFGYGFDDLPQVKIWPLSLAGLVIWLSTVMAAALRVAG